MGRRIPDASRTPPPHAKARKSSRGGFGAILGHVGPSWPILEPAWGHLGPSWYHLGAIWAHLGTVLGPSWAILGLSWAILWPPWAMLGPSDAPRWSQDGHVVSVASNLGVQAALGGPGCSRMLWDRWPKMPLRWPCGLSCFKSWGSGCFPCSPFLPRWPKMAPREAHVVSVPSNLGNKGRPESFPMFQDVPECSRMILNRGVRGPGGGR